jgi:hypothetical protein
VDSNVAFASADRTAIILGDNEEQSTTLTITAPDCASFDWYIDPSFDPSMNESQIADRINQLLEINGTQNNAPTESDPIRADGVQSSIQVRVVGDPGPGGADIPFSIRVTIVGENANGECPVRADTTSLSQVGTSFVETINLAVLRPTGPLTVILNSLGGTTVFPGADVTLRARVSGGRPFRPGSTVDCQPGDGFEFVSDDTNPDYCVRWALTQPDVFTSNPLEENNAAFATGAPREEGGVTIADASYRAPQAVGTALFTVEVTDFTGNRITTAASLNVSSEGPLSIAEASATPAQVQPGKTSNLVAAAQGGTPPYRIVYSIVQTDQNPGGTLSSTECTNVRPVDSLTDEDPDDLLDRCGVTYSAPADTTGTDLVNVRITDNVGDTVSSTIPLIVSSAQTLIVNASSQKVSVNSAGGSNIVTARVTGGTPPFNICFNLEGDEIPDDSIFEGGQPCAGGPDFVNCTCGVMPPSEGQPAIVTRDFQASPEASDRGAVIVVITARDNVGREAIDLTNFDVSPLAATGQIRIDELSSSSGCAVAAGDDGKVLLKVVTSGGTQAPEFTWTAMDALSNPVGTFVNPVDGQLVTNPSGLREVFWFEDFSTLINEQDITIKVFVEDFPEPGTSFTANQSITLTLVPSFLTVDGTTDVCQLGTIDLLGTLLNEPAGTQVFSWTGPNFNSDQLVPPPIMNVPVSAAGVYTLQTSIGDCVETGSITVDVTPDAFAAADPFAEAQCDFCLTPGDCGLCIAGACTRCGNDVIDGADGEACDDGALNGTADSCCTLDCQFKPVDTACGDQTDTECDNPNTCAGVSNTCLENFEPIDFACGDPTDTMCDNPDSCDGDGLCRDNFEAPGFACGDPTDDLCNNPDTCDGAGVCDINLEPNGNSCEANEFCIVGETCTDGVCGGGDPRDCDDFCTDNGVNDATLVCGGGPPFNPSCGQTTCDEGANVCRVINPTDGAMCEDGQLCTVGDECMNGACDPGGDQDPCSANMDDCVVEICNPNLNGNTGGCDFDAFEPDTHQCMTDLMELGVCDGAGECGPVCGGPLMVVDPLVAVCDGGADQTLEVMVANTLNVAFQWERDLDGDGTYANVSGSPFDDETTQMLTIDVSGANSAEPEDSGFYRLRVSGINGNTCVTQESADISLCIDESGCGTPECCFDNAECTMAGMMKCDFDINQCVECLEDDVDGNCGGATPVCSPATNMCVECIGDGDCGGATPVCNIATNVCVECLVAGDCDDANPCTDDDCMGDNTCDNTNDDTNDPDNGDFCDGVDTCLAGVVVPGLTCVDMTPDACQIAVDCIEATNVCEFVDMDNIPCEMDAECQVFNAAGTCVGAPGGTCVFMGCTMDMECNDMDGLALNGVCNGGACECTP